MTRASRARFARSAALLGGALLASPAAIPAHAAGVPHLDHIIVVVMENKSFAKASAQPYMSSLMQSGTSFSSSYAITHPSQPNYMALWSGDTQRTTNDDCPPPGSPYSTPNLGAACEAVGLTWKAYCETSPYAGFTGCSKNSLYTRSHCPWVSFSNLNHLNEVPYSELAIAESLGTLPNLAFVIPNQCDNAHDCAIGSGDAWLAANVPGMLQAVGNNGVVILTFDEDDHSANNQIYTVFNGHRVAPHLVSSQHINHYTLLRTIDDALGLDPIGAAAVETPITDIWITNPVQVQQMSWGNVKVMYR